ncbi:MAG: ABC transporter ATP-binding protein [Planctomycetes bacterium RBG_16_43_13]|nr:MAG: ABC transporter ATP-binding protein [Planctomycetes bacterium RBG_16_43_13]
MNNDIAIETVDLVKTYEGGRVHALNSVNIKVRKGEYLCITGPSGSGKSTFLHIIGALDYPTSGTVILNGHSLNNNTNLDKVRRYEVGFIFQLHNLIPTLTAVENVGIPMYGSGVSKRQRYERGAELLKLVGLGDRIDFIVTKLSGGERQRVAIARALANKPSLILADEPTGNLDSKTGDEVMGTILKAKNEFAATLVVVTHNPKIATDANKVLEIVDGKIVQNS